MSQSILTANDFDRLLDNYSGRLVSKIPQTKVIDGYSGDETLTDGTPINIKVHFFKLTSKWQYEKYGVLEGADAVMLSKIADAVVKDTIISADGVRYRVRDANNIPGVFNSASASPTFIYTNCSLFIDKNA